MSKSVGSVVLSEKFGSELENFFLWCVEVEYLVYKGEEEKKWNVKLNGKFEEPSRGKLEKFLVGVLEKYSIWKGDFEVNDCKLLVKEWKESVKSEKERKKGEKKVKKSDVFEVDNGIDSSNFECVNVLEYYSNELESVFGEPLEVDCDEYKYEWKIVNGMSEYSICDDNSCDAYSDMTWYVSGNELGVKSVKKLLKYIEEKKNCDEVEEEVDEKAKKVVKKSKKGESEDEVKPKKVVKKVAKSEDEVDEKAKKVVKKSKKAESDSEEEVKPKKVVKKSKKVEVKPKKVVKDESESEEEVDEKPKKVVKDESESEEEVDEKPKKVVKKSKKSDSDEVDEKPKKVIAKDDSELFGESDVESVVKRVKVLDLEDLESDCE
jgi:hypothetical protein